MKQLIIIIAALLLLPLSAIAQYEEDTENGVVSLNGKEGFTIATKKGDFVFKPYMLVQTSANINYYDDEGLDPAYNQDNSTTAVSRSLMPSSVPREGIQPGDIQPLHQCSRKRREHLATGLVRRRDEEKFCYTCRQVQDSVLARLPDYVGRNVNADIADIAHRIRYPALFLNAVTPNIGMGFDLGVEVHGLVKEKFGYEVGIFNGTGSTVNIASKTFSDDWHIPSLLYAGRVTYMPKGVMPSNQGSPNRLKEDKMLFGLSTSLNVESESESTNDFRAGAEFAMLKNRLYLGAEIYYMNVGFTKRQKINESYNYLGGYVQGGYFVTNKLQATARYDFFNRNGLDTNGFLNMPAVGFNYFFTGCNLKLQAMYQFIGRTGHHPA